MKILSGLYKGEKEDFLHTNPLNRFSMNNPSELGKRSHAYLIRTFKGNCLMV